jgi:hypothetical protein
MFLGGDGTPLQVLQGIGSSGALGQNNGIGVATTALDLGQTAFGKSGIDTSGATNVDPGSVKPGLMGVSGALKGAQAGSMFGPIGTGVGAAIGLGAGLVGGFKAKKDALKAHQNFEIAQSNKMISDFAMGGNMYAGGGPLKPWQLPSSKITDDPNFSNGFGFKSFTGAPYSTELPEDQRIDVKSTIKPNSFYKQSFNQLGKAQIPNDLGFKSKINYNDPDVTSLNFKELQENNGYYNPELAPNDTNKFGNTKVGQTLNKTGNWLNNNSGNLLRYSPVAMNAMQLAKMNKPEVER